MPRAKPGPGPASGYRPTADQRPGRRAHHGQCLDPGLLIAERRPLGEVIAELDRYRPGLLRCSAEIAGLRVSGSFSLDQPDASLDLLARTLPIRIRRVMGYWASVDAA
ncbi:hypothetical protein PBOI14_44780 [Pseudomonas sp. Boi14]|nr:hypothetical protein PBOI14_44780 [Pseudomonas sp. Boi14]